MLTKLEKFKLKQEFPEGIPAWMFERGYDTNTIRKLMKGRRRVMPDPISGTEHDFAGPNSEFKLEDWEDRVFLNADHFTVITGRSPFNRQRYEYKTFPEARLAAVALQGAMVYAVTVTGRHVMLIPKRYEHYEKLWQKRNAGE